MKKNVLMICSWLDIEKGAGLFFWEQAGFMKDEFNFIICHFKRKRFSPRNLSNLFNVKIIKQSTPNGIEVYLVDYLKIAYFPNSINEHLHRHRVRRLHKILKKENLKIDLIHAQSIFNAAFEAFYYHKISGIPFIFTEHNQFSLKGKTQYELKLLREIIKGNSPKLVVSFDKIRQFAANGIFADFEVVGNSVDETVFNYSASKDKSDNENDQLTFITVGAFDPIKDQETLLKALEIIDGELHNNVQFIWAGFNGWGTDNEKKVKKLVNSYHFKNIKVILNPLLKREQVAKELQKSDLFLFSSISEGMPVSVLEALACGLPVYTTRCGGVDELINSTNGEIFQIKDYKAISKFLLKFINKEITYDREIISKNALELYSSKAFSKRMQKIYLKAMNHNHDTSN